MHMGYQVLMVTLAVTLSAIWNFWYVAGVLFVVRFVIQLVYDYAGPIIMQIYGAMTYKSRITSYGQWAVVTGCSRGIGREMCRQLAAIGMDIVLVGRNANVLTEVSVELRKDYGVNTINVVADFNRNDKDMYTEIVDKLEKLPGTIGILVNNAATFLDYPKFFHELSERELWSSINVNIIPSTMLSHYVIKNHMLPRNKGLVVMVGSGASIHPSPTFSTYSASKAYVEFLSDSLVEDYLNTGVHVQLLKPFFVATDMAVYINPDKRESLFTPSAKDYVRQALRTFGLTTKTAGYLPHVFESTFVRDLPKFIRRPYFHHQLNMIRRENMERHSKQE